MNCILHTKWPRREEGEWKKAHALRVVVVAAVFTLKTVPIFAQYVLTSVVVQLTRTP